MQQPLLHDLLEHQFWADVELWKAIAAHPAASTDKVIHDRLHHIHQVQRFFVWAVGGGAQPALSKADDFRTLDDLKTYARESHDGIRRQLGSMDAASYSKTLTMPWFGDPPLTLTAAEALTQCAMHSHHHRAQNAARLRELGGVPPTIDLIIWYWKGRPAAAL
jgi:uncharacterized damage-inducible protein DinB